MPAEPIGANLRREIKEYLLESLPRGVRMRLRKARRGHIQRIRDLQELDVALRRAYEAFKVSEAEGRAVLDGIELIVSTPRPSGHASEEYRKNELALYERLAGRPYSTENEHSPIEVEDSVRRPHPYRTGSAEVVGDQLILLGFLMKAIGAGPPARVLELGPGWGNTTLALLQTGYYVTAVEIEPRFAEVIRRRCAEHAERLEVVTADMLTFTSARKFDVVLFFESFHHCTDHRLLLRRLHDVVAEGGRVLFVGEPIMDLPYPWGLRLDGQSLWSIRQLGWLELGFDREYFMRALRETGWTGRRLHSRAISTLPDVVVATRST